MLMVRQFHSCRALLPQIGHWFGTRNKASVHCFGSFAWIRRSRWGSARGWPVFSSHFCPAAAPHVGHGTARLCLGFNSLIMVAIMRQNGWGVWSILDRHK